MDAEHGALVIARLRANWPTTDLTPAMTDVWLDALRDVEFGDGAEAADACIADLDRFTFPQVAQFRERWKAIRRRREQPQRALAVPPPSDEQRAAALATVRRLKEVVRSSAGPRPARSTAAVTAAPVGPLPEPCDQDDHRSCGAGPIRPLKSPDEVAD